MSQKFTLNNVQVFDGKGLRQGSTVAVEHGQIVADASGGTEIDCAGQILLPGLIDAHAHVHSAEDLLVFAKHGVTTVLDMATGNRDVFGSLRGGQGTADVRSAGIPAMTAESRHGKSGKIPKSLLIAKPADAAPWVEKRVAEGSDYIKIMAEVPGIDQPTVDALCEAAHQQSRLSVAHATELEAFNLGLRGGIDVLTHMPLDEALDQDTVERIRSQHCVMVPTLIKMYGTIQHESDKHVAYNVLSKGIDEMRKASIPILAGSDANKICLRHGEGWVRKRSAARAGVAGRCRNEHG